MERLTKHGMIGKVFFIGGMPDDCCVPNFCNHPCARNYDRTCPYLQVIDRLAEFEDMVERWAFRDISDIDTLCRRVNALGGTDKMAEYHRAEKDGRLVVRPKRKGRT